MKKMIAVFAMVATILSTGFLLLRDPAKSLYPPNKLSSELKTKLLQYPDRMAANFLNAFDGLWREDEITHELLLQKELSTLDYHMRDQVCGHHWDMTLDDGEAKQVCYSKKAEFLAYRRGPRHKSMVKRVREHSFKYYLMAFDKNKDGVLLRPELVKGLTKRVGPIFEDVCDMPEVTVDARIILLETIGGAGLSTLSFEGLKGPTEIFTLDISDGKSPLYIISISNSATIINLIGATERVQNIVVQAGQVKRKKKFGQMGVVGIDKSNVTFIGTHCLKYFRYSGGERVSVAKINKKIIQSSIGRKPDIVFDHIDRLQITLPSGKMIPHDGRGRSGYENPIVDISLEDVVSNAVVIDNGFLRGYEDIYKLVSLGYLERIDHTRYLMVRQIDKMEEMKFLRMPTIIYIPSEFTAPSGEQVNLMFFKVGTHELLNPNRFNQRYVVKHD